MKRPRNVDCGKIRRPLKRSKITDGIYGSTFLYLRFLLVWALLLMADFILEFRFEYLWPFWLLLRSVYDSFKYQGLAFSVFFVCIAITSDVICYLFIPVQWLFFAASTYVWVQYVWHTERGICLPTVSLWLLFVYIEASIRLRELKSLPFNLDLCRPFACHCIGYPVVTLGFGFKSYVSYKMKLRRQKVIQKVNDSYLQILQQALPEDVRYPEKVKPLPAPPEENGSQKPSKEGKDEGKDVNEDDDSFMQKSLPNKSLNNENDANSENIPSETPPSKIKQPTSNGIVNSPPPPLQPKVSNIGQKNNTNNSQHKKGKGSRIESAQPSPSPLPFTNNKEEVIHRLETDVKKLKADLQSSRNCEQELKSQISSYSSDEKVLRSEIYQLQQDNCNLENKLHNLVTSRQQDKATLAGLEKRLAEEKKVKATLEQQLVAERKRSTAEQQATQRALSLAAASRNECTESCKSRRRDMDTELKQLRRDNKLKDDQNRQFEREVVALRQYKDTQKETEVLMKALSTMQEKNSELEKNLNAETRFKQDLFSALGKERNEIKILQTSVAEKDTEILELKSKIAEVMALIPSPAVTSHYGHTEQRNSSPLFCPAASLELHYSAPPPPPHTPHTPHPPAAEVAAIAASDLNPNATDYTPKSAI